MALAILILLIGVPVGVWMFRNPDKMWWATESWKYKNPEANEPSEAAYGMSSLGGALIVVASVIGAVSVWVGANSDDDESVRSVTSTTHTTPSRVTLDARPQERGTLPIVGYRSVQDGATTLVDLAYLVPAGSSPQPGGWNFFTEQGCEVMREVEGINTDRVTVDLQLGWTPGLKAALADDATCTVGEAWSPDVATIRLGETRPGAVIATTGAIVAPDGTVRTPAGPGNVVPLLAGAAQPG